MGRRNRRQRADETRRKIKTYESEPELGSDDELSREDSYPPLNTHVYRSNEVMAEAQVPQLQNMRRRSQFGIKVESPISNADDNPHHTVDQSKVIHRLLRSNYYRAALRGKWEDFENAPSGYTNMEITERGDRSLHIAAAAKQTALVHNLVKHLNESDLELPNKRGDTAFHIAALSAVVEMALVMYEKNNNLPRIRSSMRMTPLEMAVLLGNREMVKYLYTITPIEVVKAYEYMEILAGIIHIDMYGTARDMLSRNRKDSKLAFSAVNIGSVLKVLSQKPLSHNHTIQELLWERLVSIIATIPYIPCHSPLATLSISEGVYLLQVSGMKSNISCHMTHPAPGDKHLLPYRGDNMEEGATGSDSRANPIDPGENDEVSVEEQTLAYLERLDGQRSKKVT